MCVCVSLSPDLVNPLGLTPWSVLCERDSDSLLSSCCVFCPLQSWLKPGGKLLISDYCCGEKPWTPAFQDYVKQRGYILYTPPQYGRVGGPGVADRFCS